MVNLPACLCEHFNVAQLNAGHELVFAESVISLPVKKKKKEKKKRKKKERKL